MMGDDVSDSGKMSYPVDDGLEPVAKTWWSEPSSHRQSGKTVNPTPRQHIPY